MKHYQIVSLKNISDIFIANYWWGNRNKGLTSQCEDCFELCVKPNCGVHYALKFICKNKNTTILVSYNEKLHECNINHTNDKDKLSCESSYFQVDNQLTWTYEDS